MHTCVESLRMIGVSTLGRSTSYPGSAALTSESDRLLVGFLMPKTDT